MKEQQYDAAGGPELDDIDIQFVDSLPGGILCQPINAPGRWTMLVKKGEMTPALAAQMKHQFRAAVRLGLWRQNWD